MGNVWQGISDWVFRHADPARTQADGNAAHAGVQKEVFALPTNAYGKDVFFDIGQMGVFEPSGRWLETWEDFQAALEEQQAQVTDLGIIDDKPPLRNPAKNGTSSHRATIIGTSSTNTGMRKTS